MEKTGHIRALEAEYGEDIETILCHFYHGCGLSQPEVARELDVPRSTLQYWFRKYGIETRSRYLTDVQRVAIQVLLPFVGHGAIANHVGTSVSTVRRYRKRIEQSGEPVALRGETELTPDDRALLAAVARNPDAQDHPAADAEALVDGLPQPDRSDTPAST